MSGFEQDNFLGRSSSSDLAAEIDALKERALFRDGTKSMTGNLGMADNQIIASKDLNLSPQVTGATPATGINIYTKADNILYQKTSAGVESAVGSGGSGITTPGTTVLNNIVTWGRVCLWRFRSYSKTHSLCQYLSSPIRRRYSP